MQNSLYQFTLRVFPTDAIGSGGAAMGALVPCYAGAVDYWSALKKGVIEITGRGYRFDTIEGSVHQLDPACWGVYVAKVWPEFAHDLPTQEEVAGLVTRGKVFFGPFAGFGDHPPRVDGLGTAGETSARN